MINNAHSTSSIQLLFNGYTDNRKTKHLLFCRNNITPKCIKQCILMAFKSLGFPHVIIRSHTVENIERIPVKLYFRLSFYRSDDNIATITDFSHADDLEIYFKSINYNWSPVKIPNIVNVDFLKELQ